MKSSVVVLAILPIILPGPSVTLMAQQSTDEAHILTKLDEEFDVATAARRVDGWVSFFAPNGVMLSDTSQPTVGPADIRAAMKGFFDDSTASLRWKPVTAGMLIPGNVGYTSGTFERRRTTKAGVRMMATGRYTTVWKKQPDGSWKIILDTGISDGPPKEISR